MNGFTPDYEMSVDANMDNVYEVTVVATVAGMSGTRDVKVTVENIEELGAVTLNRTPPRVGLPVTATLTDPDGSISGFTWQWSIIGTTASTDQTPDGPIEGETSDTYVPKAGDVGGTLTATAMYDDGHSSEGLAKKTAYGRGGSRTGGHEEQASSLCGPGPRYGWRAEYNGREEGG